MKKIILALSMLVAMAVVFGFPDLGMAGIPPGECTSDPECDDANACTTDTCDLGLCSNTPINCDDIDACTTDFCVPQTGCETTPIICDDINACTTDSCDPGTGCVNTPINCDDIDACTTDFCVPQTGCETTPIICDDGVACTNDTCDQATGCEFTPDDTACDDLIECTDDSCDSMTGCVNTNDDTNTCSDGDLCTENDACASGACAGAPIDCDDMNLCTADECDSGTGVCVNDPDCSLDESCDLGSGDGCSAIEGVDATTLVNGNCFTGKIGTTSVSGVNPKGKQPTNSDSDAFTNGLEECLNDSLIGFCTEILVDDTGVIDLIPGMLVKKDKQQFFTVTFLDVSGCGITECSDNVDNDGDTLIDFSGDPECDDFSDDDESS